MALEGVLMGVVLVLSGLAAFVWNAHSIYQQRKRLADAREVEATVDSEEVGVEQVSGGEDPKYEVTVSYRYEVDGREYHSDNVYPGNDRLPTRDVAREVAEEYGPGQRVTAYVMPGDPETAYLRPEWRYRGVIILLVVGTSMTLFGVFVLDQVLGLGITSAVADRVLGSASSFVGR